MCVLVKSPSVVVESIDHVVSFLLKEKKKELNLLAPEEAPPMFFLGCCCCCCRCWCWWLGGYWGWEWMAAEAGAAVALIPLLAATGMAALKCCGKGSKAWGGRACWAPNCGCWGGGAWG